MRRRLFLGAAAAALTCRAQGRGDVEGAARDLLNQALEQLWERSSPAQVKAALRLIRLALDESPEFGDAHYYRALCLRRMGGPDRDAMASAAMYRSEALADRRDPFQLAAPQIIDDYLKRVGDKWALVVGIGRFRDRAIPRLNYAADDAASMSALLADANVGRFRPERVVPLLDDRADTAAIKENLDRICMKARPEDIVVAYFATHGSSRDADHKQVSYLYTHDTDVSRPEKVFATALPLVEVSGIVSTRCRALRTLLIFDTCHSGAALSDQSLSDADCSRLKAGAGRYVLSSCGIDQISYEAQGHGLFTRALLQTLAGKRGCVRMQELYRDVRDAVARETQGKQQPVMAKSDDAGDLVIGANTGSASEACRA